MLKNKVDLSCADYTAGLQQHRILYGDRIYMFQYYAARLGTKYKSTKLIDFYFKKFSLFLAL